MPRSEIDWFDMVDLLGSTPCDRATVQSYLESGFGIRVPRTTYQVMFDRLEEELGFDAAVSAVFEVVLATASTRLDELLEAYEEGGEAKIRLKEPKVIDLLFDYGGEATELGEALIEYRRRTRGTSAPKPEPPPSPTPERSINTQEMPSASPANFRFSDIVSGQALTEKKSAPQGGGWRLERVRPSSATFLKADPKWRERTFEDFLVENWDQVDFGFEEPLSLIGRQVRLTGSQEKVDLLARTSGDTWVVIELKVITATGAHFTQLSSYMHDLTSTGILPEQIRGVLIAPAFSEKVLKASANDRRVRLLRFMMEE